MSRHTSSTSHPVALTHRDLETLARSFDIEGLRLTMAVGVLIIEGQVPCYRLKKLAGAAAAQLMGILHPVNRLRVVPQSHRRDAELAEAVRAALQCQSALREARIAVTTRYGIVTLRGSVPSYALRCQAEEAVWAVGGAINVENQLQVQPLPARNDRMIPKDAPLSAACR